MEMKQKMKKLGVVMFFALITLFLIPSALAADTVTVTAPNGGEYWRATQSITWTQETTDATNDTFYVGYHTGGAVTWINTSLAAGTTSYSWDTTSVSDGSSYKINVTKVNANVGNASDESNAVFTVDNTAPTVAITMSSVGISGGHVYTKESTLDFEGSISDATAGNKNISVDGTSGSISGNTWSVSSVSISTGLSTVTATGYDNAGNSGTGSVTVHRSIEKTGSSYVPPSYYQQSAKNQPLAILNEDGEMQEGMKIVGVIVLMVILFLVWWKWK